jgi:putative tricarboxylic transport membrane protein
MRRHQVGSALFLLLFGIYVSYESSKLVIGTISKPEPGFFPFWLGISLVLVSSCLLIQFTRSRAASVPSDRLWQGLRWEKILFSLVALLLYAFFLEALGYMIATFLLMLFLFLVIGSRGWVVSLFGSIITSLLTYGLFKIWLQVQLPKGIWG